MAIFCATKVSGGCCLPNHSCFCLGLLATVMLQQNKMVTESFMFLPPAGHASVKVSVPLDFHLPPKIGWIHHNCSCLGVRSPLPIWTFLHLCIHVLYIYSSLIFLNFNQHFPLFLSMKATDIIFLDQWDQFRNPLTVLNQLIFKISPLQSCRRTSGAFSNVSWTEKSVDCLVCIDTLVDGHIDT